MNLCHWVVTASLLVQFSFSAISNAAEVGHLTFEDDVQPILRRHCYRCHGSKNQEASLQLNLRSAAMGLADSDEPIIVKHDADASLLILRTEGDAHGDQMPPDAAPLTKREISVLRLWVDQGAPWPNALAEPKHWAYQPITRPEISEGHSSKTAIDYFIARRLKQRGLAMAGSVDRARLIRRGSLALIGVPPTPAEVQRFVDDPSANAYEKVVDRLLESPRYGERWAVPWLDLARYADSNGFQADQIRDNWAYRDWVIRAINDGLPFDQFVVDQIAGDLRENATVDQRIATGFHRMTTCNVEAGVHPEANRVNQVVDRVNTTATIFLGTTFECAQCHEHKYDPFTQEDYYGLFAYFNSTPLEVKNTSGVTWDFYGPTMELPRDEDAARRHRQLNEQLARLEGDRKEASQASDEEFDQWLSKLRESHEVAWKPLVPENFESSTGEEFTILDDGAVLLAGSVPDTVEHVFTFAYDQKITAVRLDVLTDDAIPGKGPGRGDSQRTNIILNEFTCQHLRGGKATKIKLQDAAADFSQSKWHVSGAIDGDRKSGWAIAPQFGKPHWASFVLAQPMKLEGDKDRLRITLSQFYGRGRVIGKPRISVYSGDTTFLNLDDSLRELAAKKKLNKADTAKLRKHFNKDNPRIRRLDRQLADIKKELQTSKPDTTLVMVEMDQPRETAVMIRGDYENLGQKVQPGTPAALPGLESIERTGDRLELAHWLTSPENPLLARVTVNRWWAEIFGTGLVSTLEDFGTQGEDPSHPELLDWLASELIESGWSRKHVHKLIVMSDAYRQSSRVTPELLEIDPTNRLISRGPRFRLAAELLRDNALAISGLLSDKMYGPPIMPYQPDNIWRSVGRNQPKWSAAQTEDRFRRGVYVVWKRAAPYPSFINFDAPDRGSCTVNRGRSNTPLQALTLLNDPAYAEMALGLADRILSDAPANDDASRLEYGMQLAVARRVSTYEISVLKDLLDREREMLKQNESMISGRTKVPFREMSLRFKDPAELAAWFAVANALLNLDETMSQ